MVFLLILFVALLIAAIMVFYASQSNSKTQKSQVVCATKLRNVVMSSNPVDGIHFGGVMGFALGDSYEFCLSRFKHLKLQVNEDDFESETYKSGISSYRNQYVIWGKNTYDNINEVSFCYGQNKVLQSITIDVDFSENGKNYMYNILISRISRVLGVEPFMCTGNFSKWTSSKGSICLSIYSENFGMLPKSEKLLIQIMSH